MLVEQLQPERDLSYTPLFQVMLVLQNAPQQAVEWAGVQMRALELESGTAKYDLTLGLAESERGLVGTLEYNCDLYERESMERLAGHYRQVLSGLVSQVEQRVWAVRLLSEVEEAEVLRQGNERRARYEVGSSLTELFERQVEQRPEATALLWEERQVSYAELNARANQLAHYLRGLGVGPESLVALVMERSVEMVVGVLGVLKAGGAYLPIDPAYPSERVRFMLEDAGAAAVLTTRSEGAEHESSKARVVRLADAWQKITTEPDANLESVSTADNLAYVIYTSGSTGRPKGVFVSNRNLIHSTTARFGYYKNPVGTFLLLSSFAFDSSVAGIFWTLAQGGTLLLPSQGIERDPSELRALINKHHVSDMLCLPSLYALLLDQAQPDQLASLRTVIVAGESCPLELIATHYELLDQAVLFNEYGPTEGTVWSTVARFEPDTTEVTIGSRITNVCVYVLDEHLNIVPIGVGGEIYIGGEGLARGYMNQPALTAQRFIPNPFSRRPGARLYKTGDLARYRSGGDLNLLGRNDHQVKLRGYRIELSEIEAVMTQHPDVREVVVMCREDSPNDKRIVAYLVPAKESVPSTSDLRHYLQAELPAYMVPSVFVTLNELPFGPNGKVDRNALPAPEGVRPELNILYAAPETQIEKRLAEIWGSVLNVERIGRDDNFFDLGGHSFLVVKVHERIRQEMQVEIPLIKLFEFPTIYGLSQFLDNQQVDSINTDETEAWASRRRQALQRQRQALRN
jgi:amino acid adenylation domain-containing protein